MGKKMPILQYYVIIQEAEMHNNKKTKLNIEGIRANKGARNHP
jgi:hypothetical protein